MFGIVNLDKPHDVTSRDVVNHVQRLVRPHKVGHAGTLDPLATGVLVICVGQATRLNEFVQQHSKSYVGHFLLGRQSDTEDTEGVVEELVDPPVPTREDIDDVVQQFRGAIMQRPPAFSALKVKGRRAYALARQGQEVRLPSRPVVVHRLEVVRYEYPELVLDVTCGSGTYLRSLGRDIGEALGSAAVMAALRRTAVGPFTVERACGMDELTSETIATRLLPPALAVEHLPRLILAVDEIEALAAGRTIAHTLPAGATFAAAVDTAGQLVAIVAAGAEGIVKPYRNFSRLVR